MSLINDALKRAKQAQAQPPAAVVAEPALEPVITPAANATQPPWLLPGSIFLILLLAFWFLILWWRASHPDNPTQGATASVDPSAEVMAAATELVKRQVPKPTRLPAAISSFATEKDTSMARPALATTSAPPAVTEPAPKPEARSVLPAANAAPPDRSEPVAIPPSPALDQAAPFRLQGIFYRSSQASAVINGQTLFVGDEIDGAKLLAIERQSVRLRHNGQTNVLKLH
jgi:hypothetical protein